MKIRQVLRSACIVFGAFLAAADAFANPRESAKEILREFEVAYLTAGLLDRMCSWEVVRWNLAGDEELEDLMLDRMRDLGFNDIEIREIVLADPNDNETVEIENAMADGLDERGFPDFNNFDFGTGYLMNLAPRFSADGTPVSVPRLCNIAIAEIRSGSMVGRLLEHGEKSPDQ